MVQSASDPGLPRSVPAFRPDEHGAEFRPGAAVGVADPAEGAVAGTGVPGLVGRARELAALRARLAEAAAGRGGVVALGGEPGIGKTRLAQAFAAIAHAGGAAVRWGRCYEGEWAPPYGPWLEALAEHARAVGPDRLRSDLVDLGPWAAPLGQAVPALRAVLPDPAPPPPLTPEEERFRLNDAAARFLLAAAREQPLLVVLDDLQWADRPSLALLRHVARLADRAKLLIVVTYRDGGLDREHRLTDALAELRREAAFAALPVKGLDREEVTDLLAQAVRREVSPELGRAIHGETGGNPFYVREVMRHLLDEGALVDRDGRWAAERGIRELGVPEGVRQVVGRRLARLSAPTRRLLDHAAVFTGGVDFAVLLALTGLPEEDLLDALDEALAAQVLRAADNRRETYEFAHAIVRHALVAEWARNPSRVARLHRQAAEALERVHAGHELAHAAELAIQYHASAALPGAARGVPYALAAAEQARAAYARERAVDFLRIARDLSGDLDPGSRGTILCRLATAEAEALLLADAQRTVPEALAALAAGEAAPSQVAAFLTTLAQALKASGAEGAVWRPLVERGLALVGNDHGLTWARLTLLIDPVEPIPSEVLRAGRWLGFDPEAVAVARLHGDEEDYARTLEPFDPRDRLETRALIALGRSWSRPTAVLRALTVAANELQYRHGAFAEAMDLWREVQATAERYGATSWQAQALNQLTLLHVARGEFGLARETEARTAELVARLGPIGGGAGEPEAIAAERTSSFALYLDGDWPALAAFWTRFGSGPATGANEITTLAGPVYAAMAALAHARAGTTAEARRLLAALTPILESMDPKAGNHNGAVALAADAVWTLEARDLAAAYRRLALDVIGAGVGDYPQTSNQQTVARMATLRGDPSEARPYFAQAREVLEASGQRPLRAIVDHDEALAEAGFDGAGGDRIGQLLDAALAAFADLGMAGWGERTQELAARIGPRAEGRAIYPAGLSEREADVLRLIARGYSDRQISDELFISPRTVNAHVRNMLTKTNRINRTELSVWAVEHGLVASAER